MTIEIRELVIKATVHGAQKKDVSDEHLQALLAQQKQQILKECKAQMRAQLLEQFPEITGFGRMPNER